MLKPIFEARAAFFLPLAKEIDAGPVRNSGSGGNGGMIAGIRCSS